MRSARGDRLGRTGAALALGATLAASVAEATSTAAPAAAAPAAVPASGAQATQQAAQAGYVWGLPLVEALRTRAAFVCHTPVNTFAYAPRLATPADRQVVTPNTDTLYSLAWLDLRRGPVLLSTPKVTGRYYVFQLLDAYTNTFANVGSHTIGSGPARTAIVPPGWTGKLPAGVRSVTAPTPDVWVLGPTLVSGPADLPAVAALQQQYRLSPLTVGSAPATPEPVATSCANPPSPQIVAPAGARFFDELGSDLAADPPPAADHAIVSRLSGAGIGAGRTPTRTLPGAGVAELAAGVRAGDQTLTALARTSGPLNNGWHVNYHIGTYGQQYLVRAVVAVIGLGANVASEALYFSTQTDITGAALDGRSSYRLHFAAGQLPPVSGAGFWSVTMYGPDHFLVANPLNRYALSDHTAGLAGNPDGSLDLYLGRTQPAGHVSNWLPVPTQVPAGSGGLVSQSTGSATDLSLLALAGALGTGLVLVSGRRLLGR